MAKKFWQSAPSNWKEQAELADRLRQQQMEEEAFGADTGTPSTVSQMLRTGRVLPSQSRTVAPPKLGQPTPTQGGFTVSRPQQPTVHQIAPIREKPLTQAHGFTPPNPLQIAARNVKNTLVGDVTDFGKTVIGSVAASHPEWQPGLKEKGLLPGEEPTVGGTLAGLAGFMGRAYTPEEIAGNPLLGLGPEAQIAGDVALKAAGPVARQIGQGVKGYPKKLVETAPRVVPERQAMGLAKKVPKAGEARAVPPAAKAGQAKEPEYVTVYHGTTAQDAENIKRVGLKRSYKTSASGTPDYAPSGIYVTGSVEEATKYGDGTIIELKIPKRLITPDPVDPESGKLSFLVDRPLIPKKSIVRIFNVPTDVPILDLGNSVILRGSKAIDFYTEKVNRGNYRVGSPELVDLQRQAMSLSEPDLAAKVKPSTVAAPVTGPRVNLNVKKVMPTRIPDEAPSIEGVGFPQRETPLTVEGAGERPIRQGPPKGPIEPPTTGAAVPQEGFAANIRLSKYPEETRGLIKEWADAHPNEVQAARRGVRSDTQVLADAEALVNDLGGSFQKLQKKWSPGEAWNAEELLAIRGTLRSKTEAVLAAQAEAKASGNSAKSLIDLDLALREQALVQEMVHGVTAEAGRALRSFRQLAFEAKDDAAKLEKLLEMLGGRDKLGDIAQKIGQLDVNNPASVNAFIRSVTKPKMSDYLIELFYNSILSGPKTHIVNSASNTLVALLSPVERGVAGIVDAPIALLQGRARQRFAREAFVDIYGALQGLPEGLQSALYTMKHGISPAQATKWEFRQKAFKGVLGRIINTPSTALEAADVMMRQINYRASINAEAYRLARMEGKTGFAAMPRVAELLANPTKELMERSAKVAEYRLFRQEPGKFAAWLMTGRDTVTPFGIPVLRFVIPFIRTPVNLVKFGLERSPAGFLNPSLWRHLAKSSPEAAEEISRAAIGSLVAGTVALYVAQGKITGAAPTSAAQRDQFYREGKQSYSVLVGDRWVSYQRVEPFNQVLSQVAAVVNAIAQEDKSVDQMAFQVVNTIGQNFVSQTYMSSISDLIEGIQQPGVSGSRLITRLITSVTPPFSAASRTAAQMVDPTIRQPSDIVEQAQANIPGLSRNVPARIDVFGEDIERQSAAWLPISVTQSKGSGLDKELKRLGVTIGFVGNTIREIELSDAQHNEYKRLAGQFTKRNLEETLADPLYEKKSDVEKERVLNSAISDARNEARGIILSQRDDAASKTMGKEYLGRIKAERQLKPYFSIGDEVYAEYANTMIGSESVKSYRATTDLLIDQLNAIDDPYNPERLRLKVLVAARRKPLAGIENIISQRKLQYRMQHPESDALLWKWYKVEPLRRGAPTQSAQSTQTAIPRNSDLLRRYKAAKAAGTLVR